MNLGFKQDVFCLGHFMIGFFKGHKEPLGIRIQFGWNTSFVYMMKGSSK